MHLHGAPALSLLTRHRIPTVFGVTVGFDPDQPELPPQHLTRLLRLSLSLDRERAAPVVTLEQIEPAPLSEQAVIDSLHGLHNYQIFALANALELPRAIWHPLADAAQHIYRALIQTDALMISLDPLSFEADGRLVMLNASIYLDDSASFRHPEFALTAPVEADEERVARLAGISYVRLGGQIGCIANGAGLAMASIDLIAAAGAEHGLGPANFMDVGGSARADTIETGLRLLLQYHSLRAIMLSIFGGLTRADEVAQGIIAACGEAGLPVPLVLRLHGSDAQHGRARLDQAGVSNLIFAASLSDAVRAVVSAAKG